MKRLLIVFSLFFYFVSVRSVVAQSGVVGNFWLALKICIEEGKFDEGLRETFRQMFDGLDGEDLKAISEFLETHTADEISKIMESSKGVDVNDVNVDNVTVRFDPATSEAYIDVPVSNGDMLSFKIGGEFTSVHDGKKFNLSGACSGGNLTTADKKGDKYAVIAIGNTNDEVFNHALEGFKDQDGRVDNVEDAVFLAYVYAVSSNASLHDRLGKLMLPSGMPVDTDIQKIHELAGYIYNVDNGIVKLKDEYKIEYWENLNKSAIDKFKAGIELCEKPSAH